MNLLHNEFGNNSIENISKRKTEEKDGLFKTTKKKILSRALWIYEDKGS